MVYRYSWVAGLLALLFAFFRVDHLLRPTVEGPPWQLVVIAGVLLGSIITWTALSYRLPLWLTALLNAAAFVVAAVRIAVPDTTFAFLPTASSVTAMGDEMSLAWAVIRNGVSPVIPIAGIVVLMTAVFWAAGAALVWGLVRARPYAALLPLLVLGVQFATMDRFPTSNLAITVFVSITAFTFLAIRLDQRDQGVGRMARPGRWTASAPTSVPPTSALLLGSTVLAAVIGSGLMTGLVPYDGTLSWRSSSGLTGGFYGSVSYNPFISIRQGLVSNTNQEVFRAQIDGPVAADQVYFRLVTMEHFDGVQFSADRPVVRPLGETWEADSQRFIGPTAEVVQDIEIRDLQMDWIPEAYSPVEIQGRRGLLNNLRVRGDGSLIIDGGLTSPGLRYQVTSLVPQPDLDVLASGADGGLSPAFAAAAAEGAPDLPNIQPEVVEPRELVDADVFLEIPDDLDEGIRQLAISVTANLGTDYERGLAIEAFLREFTYTLEVAEGHGSSDLAAWLLDPSSPNYRQGYCEQFATSMAVLARTLEIPSRVVLGFTPGQHVGDDIVIVRDSNAHAWVELWLPTQGWVRFDPTPRSDQVNPATFAGLGFDVRPFLELPDPESQDVASAPLPAPQFAEDFLPPGFIGSGGGEVDAGFTLPTWARWVVPVLATFVFLFALVPGIKWWRRKRRMKRLREGDITAAWESIIARLTDLGDRPDAALTPTELAGGVDPAMEPLALVYSEAIYGGRDSLGGGRLELATQALETTEARLTTRYSRFQRIVAMYRPATLLPRRLRRR